MTGQTNILHNMEEKIWDALQEVPDPEIPTLSVVDLGIITGVAVEGHSVKVTMTPTFSGCPAIKYMQQNIRQQVQNSFPDALVEVNVDYETQWTTNRITEKGLEALKNFGLATPRRFEGELEVEKTAIANCPHCNSANTSMNSLFGPTLCRSIHYCFDCKQSFEQFKPL